MDALGRDVISDLAMLERLVPPSGKDVVDVGCGGGALVPPRPPGGARRRAGRGSRAGLHRATTVDYDVRLPLAGMPALRTRIVSVDPARAGRFDARVAELEAAFERLGEPGERAGERCFLQPMRADVLRPVLSWARYSDAYSAPSNA